MFCSNRFKKKISHLFGVEKIARFSFLDWHDGIFYFRGTVSGSDVFIKYDSLYGFYTNEILASQLLEKSTYCRYTLPLLAYGQRCLIYPFVEDMRLDEYLAVASLEESDLNKIQEQLVDILFMLRSNNLIHRDLTLKNIFISKNGRLRVFDFYFCVSDKYPFKDFQSWIGRKLVLSRLGYKMEDMVWNDTYSLINSIQVLSEKRNCLVKLKNFLITHHL